MPYPGPMCGDRFEFEKEMEGVPAKERPDWPLPSFDARDWAEAFVKTAMTLGYSAMDEGWLQSWFANALMRGYDERAARDAP